MVSDMSRYFSEAQRQHVPTVREEVTKAMRGEHADLPLVAQFLDELYMLSARYLRPLTDAERQMWFRAQDVIHQARRLSDAPGEINTTRDLDRALRRYDEAEELMHIERTGGATSRTWLTDEQKTPQTLALEAVRGSATAVGELRHRLERAEAALRSVRAESQQLVGMDDPFGSQGPPILVGANAYFEVCDVLGETQEEARAGGVST